MDSPLSKSIEHRKVLQPINLLIGVKRLPNMVSNNLSIDCHDANMYVDFRLKEAEKLDADEIPDMSLR